jgi:hypothetical protein
MYPCKMPTSRVADEWSPGVAAYSSGGWFLQGVTNFFTISCRERGRGEQARHGVVVDFRVTGTFKNKVKMSRVHKLGDAGALRAAPQAIN